MNMKKTILLTGATDGIGLELARLLAAEGHHLLLHGRNPEKLQRVQGELEAIKGVSAVECFRADLSHLAEVESMAKDIAEKHAKLDVLINNAGVFETSTPRNDDGFDVRFLVNTLAPYLLSKQLLPIMQTSGRVISLSSAAQAPVDVEALRGKRQLEAFAAYAQSKLALTMWSRWLGVSVKEGPLFVSVNPGSMLGTKMVKEAFGVAGNDIAIGADILHRAALSEEFAQSNGRYFDNDSGQFSDAHPDAQNDAKCEHLITALDALLTTLAPGPA